MFQSRTRLVRWVLPLLLVLGATPLARADDVTALVAKLQEAGARVVWVTPDDARLKGEGQVRSGVGADGKVEVYLPRGGTEVRTPLKSPTRRMTVAEFRELVADMKGAVRELYGIEVERVYIAGSSSGRPYRDNTNTLRTFDRKGPFTSDYDGALVSPELFEKVRALNNRRLIRGRSTGLRTAPDPLPELRERFKAIETKYGRHVAAMIYASDAEFQKRMELTGLEVGKNPLVEPGPNSNMVEVTRAELIGALIETGALTRLVEAHGQPAAAELLERARAGDAAAQETVRQARVESVKALRAGATWNPVDSGSLADEAKRLESPNRFAARRGGPRGPPEALAASEARLQDVFETLRRAALARGLERVSELPLDSRNEALRTLSRARGTRLEILPSNDLILEYDAKTNSVRASTGLLNKIERAAPAPGEPASISRNKALGLLLGHELAHATGIKSETVADAEAVRALEKAPTLRTAAGKTHPVTNADVRRVIDLFHRGAGRLSDVLYALRNLARGTPGSRTRAMEGAVEGRPDALASYRRADGTLNWKRLTADRALSHGAGVAHFALALFLKELAVVVRTGDRVRIDEFFEGLATTDFFVTYGLFSAGAHVGNVAYSRYLARYVKPRFVSGILRTNIVLATGMALPEIVRGHFDGRTFAINVASLGLSATAVKTGLEGIKWVMDLRKAERTGKLLRTGANLRRLAKLGGWFYTVAETAVVLYLGDEIARAVTRHLDDRAARKAILAATRRFYAATRDESLSPAAFGKEVDAFTSAHAEYRNYLYRPLSEAEALYLHRLTKAARKAKILADKRGVLIGRLDKYPSLKAWAVAKYGSEEAYAAKLLDEHVRKIDEDVAAAMESYERSRASLLEEIYRDNRRSETYLKTWSIRGVAYSDDISGNRLQAYEDEIRALTLAREMKAGASSDELAALDEALRVARETLRRDRALGLQSSRGASGALSSVTR